MANLCNFTIRWNRLIGYVKSVKISVFSVRYKFFKWPRKYFYKKKNNIIKFGKERINYRLKMSTTNILLLKDRLLKTTVPVTRMYGNEIYEGRAFWILSLREFISICWPFSTKNRRCQRRSFHERGGKSVWQSRITFGRVKLLYYIPLPL